MSERDVFRPRHDPARMVYDAFKREAKKRRRRISKGWVMDDWGPAECRAVWIAARDWAQSQGIHPPTLAQVADAEQAARGHVDYGAKWAYAVARLLTAEAA